MRNRVIFGILLVAALVVGTAQTSHADGKGPRGHGFRRHGVVVPHRFFFHERFRHHPGFRTRVFIGTSYWWGPAYPAYVEPPLVIQGVPPAYAEQPPAEQQPSYWYYCPNPSGYYPYVQECPPGWLTVVPPTTLPPAASPPGSAPRPGY